MVDLGAELEIKGPYTTQTRLAKVALVLAWLASIDLLVIVPVAVACALVAGVGQRVPEVLANTLPLLLFGGMLCIGAWMNDMFLDSFSAGRLPRRARFAFFAMIRLIVAGLSAIAIAVGFFSFAMICVFAFAPIAAITSWLLTAISRLVHGPT